MKFDIWSNWISGIFHQFDVISDLMFNQVHKSTFKIHQKVRLLVRLFIFTRFSTCLLLIWFQLSSANTFFCSHIIRILPYNTYISHIIHVPCTHFLCSCSSYFLCFIQFMLFVTASSVRLNTLMTWKKRRKLFYQKWCSVWMFWT